MKYTRIHVLLFLIVPTCFYSCVDKTICPAFQSYYVLDEDKKKDMFAYFGEDSLPKIQDAHVRKGKYGVIEKASYFGLLPGKLPKNDYKERMARINSLRMEVIYPSDEEEEELDLSAELPESQQTNQYESNLNLELPEYTDLADSGQAQGLESADTILFHYNVDQMAYMKLFGDDIMANRQIEKDSLAADHEEGLKNKDGQVGDKKKKGFFKKIFGGGKKKKKKGDALVADGEGSSTTDVEAGQELSKADKKKKKAEDNARKKAEKAAAKQAAKDAKEQESTLPPPEEG